MWMYNDPLLPHLEENELDPISAAHSKPDHRIVVVAPTYNNADTLRSIVERILEQWPKLIIVNDGSSDETKSVLAGLGATHSEDALIIVHHPENRGKAKALLTGFARAKALDYTHAVTIDTDGQLDPEQIPEMIERSESAPHAMVIGTRDDRAEDYPPRSRLGRRLTGLAIRLETGHRVEDNQCGFRVYPLDLFDVVSCRMGRFSFETEIVTRALWAGYDVVSVPVRCRYFAGAERVSHYRIVRDNLEGTFIHMFLLLRALFPMRLSRPDGAAPPLGKISDRGKISVWRRLGQWLSPVELWRQLRRDNVARSTIAFGVGCGVFIANLPCYGFHTVLSLYVARRMHIHPVAVVLGSQIAMPPLSPLLIMAGITVGFISLHGRLPMSSDFDLEQIRFLDLFSRVLLEWTVGGVIVGVIMAITASALTLSLMKFVPLQETDGDSIPASVEDAQSPLES